MAVNNIARSQQAQGTAPTPSADRSVVRSHTLLRVGSSGAEVRDLQKRLTEAGFDGGSDGKFTEKTAAAVRAFQQANGLQVDGLVGQQT
jgi:peptidoglycan hydrolase-like protein with peptidoglycan-binding domain